MNEQEPTLQPNQAESQPLPVTADQLQALGGQVERLSAKDRRTEEEEAKLKDLTWQYHSGLNALNAERASAGLSALDLESQKPGYLTDTTGSVLTAKETQIPPTYEERRDAKR